MSNKSLKFRFSNERPLDLEPYTVYFIKAEGQTNITIVADDPENFASVISYDALEDIINARFKAFGNTQKEARDAISAVGVSELAKVFFSSDVHYFPTNTLNNSLEELEFGKYLISFTQDPEIELPPFSGQSFFYLEVKNSYSVAIDAGRILEATAYNTGVRAIKVRDTEKRWSTWRVVAFETSNVASSTKLQTARTIGGVSFDGTTNINLPGVNTAGNQNTSGNAATATKLQTAHTIGGVSFNGTANISLPGVNTKGNQDTTGRAAVADISDATIKLETPRTINGTSFDGTENITTTSWGVGRTVIIGRTGRTVNGSANVAWTADEVLPTGTNGQVLKHNGTSWVAGTDANITYGTMSVATAEAGTSSLGELVSGSVLKATVEKHGATKSFVQTEISNAVSSMLGGAPSAALDTLVELGAALGNDANFSSTVTLALSNKLDKTGGVVTGDINAPSFTGVLVGNASTATKLATARTIGGVSFDGSANINLPGVNTAGTQNTSGNAGTATKLATARSLTVGRTGKNFDGTANVVWSLDEILPTGTNGQIIKHNGTSWVLSTDANTTYTAMPVADANTGTSTTAQLITPAALKAAINTHAPEQTSVTGNAGTSTKLATVRTIGGVSFDGTANINLPGVNTAGNQNTTGNAATATKLATARSLTIGAASKNFDGSANVSWTLTEVLPTGSNGKVLKHNGTTWVAGTDDNTTYGNMSEVEANAGTATTGRAITAAVLKTAIQTFAPAQTTITGNAGSATKLATVRTINGTNFDGTANITTANWGTARNLTIGDTTKSVNGSGNISWSLSEIGAAAASHTHSYLPLTGGTLQGPLLFNGAGDFMRSGVDLVGGTGYGAFWRIDANNLYLMVTANNDPNGTWTTARPIQLSFSSGVLNINGSSTKLQTPRTINGTNFDGSANITTVNWGTARNLTIGRTAKSVNGSANVAWTADEVLPTGANGQVLKHDGTSWVAGTDNNTTYGTMSAADANTGTATTARLITPAVLKTAINTHAPVQTTVTGNAGTATKLATARTLTLGSTGKTFDGSANVAWTLAEIGAAAASHSHSYLPLTGGTLTGNLNLPVITESAVALGTGNSLNLASGSVFSKTITAATTLTLTNTPASGSVCSFILEITNGGNFAVTWWSGIKWPDNKVPTLTSNGTDNIGFYTTNAGVTWKVLGMFNG